MLKQRMKSTVPVRSITGTSTNGMAYHVNGCLEDISPDTVILYRGTNGNTWEKIATDMANLAWTMQSKKIKVFISGLTIRTDNLDQKSNQLRLQNLTNVILGHLNFNSLRNKIEAVEELMWNNIDISLFSETKLDEILPNEQFKISGYKMFRRDRNKHGGGISLHFLENLSLPLTKMSCEYENIMLLGISTFLSRTKTWSFY